MRITKISSEAYHDAVDAVVLFVSPHHNHSYGTLFVQNKQYKMGWASELIEPSVLCLFEHVLCIGIDQVFIIYDCCLNKLILKLDLDFYFCTMEQENDFLFVNTELEIFEINLHKGTSKNCLKA